MQIRNFTIIFLFLSLAVSGQDVITFEDQVSRIDTFKNGQAGEGDFQIGPLLFPNEYDFDNDFWSGQWAMSSSTNDSVPNFLNLYGCIAGQGAAGSSVYAVAQEPIYGNPLNITSSSPIMPQKVQITNTTYAYNVIKDGNQFSKAFGGPSGDDPDYFYIQWNGYLDGELQGSNKFYLADYRFSNNSEDYIIEQWTEFDLSALGVVDSIQIDFYSTDTGDFGINTPLFFAIDNFEFEQSSSLDQIQVDEILVYPNPTQERIFWKDGKQKHDINIYDLTGKLMTTATHARSIDIGHLQKGVYLLEWRSGNKIGLEKIVKE